VDVFYPGFKKIPSFFQEGLRSPYFDDNKCR
jgi:hypothetical protein